MKLIVFATVLLFFPNSFAEDFSMYFRGRTGTQQSSGGCDAMVCKDTSSISVSNSFTSSLGRLGVRISGNPIHVNPPASLDIPDAAPEAPAPSVITARPRGGGGGRINNSTAATPASGPDSETTKPGTQQSNASSGAGSAGGGNMTPPKAPDIQDAAGNGTQQIIGGVPYVDDEEEIKADVKTPGSMNNTTVTNTPLETGGKKRDVASTNSLPAVSGDNSPGDSPLGNYESGKRVNAASSGSAKSAAAEALEKLNSDDYFGAPGSGRSGRRKIKKGSSPYKKGQRIAKLDKFGNPIMSKAELQRRLLRNLASTGQLGKKNEFLFFSMCKHYDHYEKSNNINYGRSKCPPKK